MEVLHRRSQASKVGLSAATVEMLQENGLVSTHTQTAPLQICCFLVNKSLSDCRGGAEVSEDNIEEYASKAR